MPLYLYRGYRSDGSSVSGTIEADGVRNAVIGVKALGIHPSGVKEYIQGQRRWFSPRLDLSLLPYLTRQLSVLLSSGVPLVDALKSLSEESKGLWKTLLVDIRERVAGGSGLSRSLEERKDVFPEFYIHMVSAGEQSGGLDKALARVADFLEKQATVRARIRAAMVYPSFMAAVGFTVLAFLFTFVVPKIVRIFENTKAALPLATVVLISISNVFVHYWWLILMLLMVSVLTGRKALVRYRLRVDEFKLKAPGGILQSLYYGRFARTLGFLLEGGLPVLRALELAAKTSGNSFLEGKINDASDKVAEGARLSASLEGFPAVLLQLIATGERTGTLPALLGKAADSYEEEFERRVQKALSLLEPSMILLMGFIVGFIVLAVLLPMFQLNQLVK